MKICHFLLIFYNFKTNAFYKYFSFGKIPKGKRNSLRWKVLIGVAKDIIRIAQTLIWVCPIMMRYKQNLKLFKLKKSAAHLALNKYKILSFDGNQAQKLIVKVKWLQWTLLMVPGENVKQCVDMAYGQEEMQSNEFWLYQHDFPEVAHVLLLAHVQLAVFLQQPLLLAHAQLSLLAADPHKAAVPPGTETIDLPWLLLLRAHHIALLYIHEALSERMIDVHSDAFIFITVFTVLAWLWESVFGFDQLPDVVLCDVVGVVGTAGDLVEGSALGDLDLVRVQIIFGLYVAEYQRIVHVVWVTHWIYLMQRLIEDVKIFLFHLHDAPHEDGSIFLCNFRDGIVQVFSEGGIDVGGEAGRVYALFFLDDFVGPGLAATALASAAALLVGLPLLLLRVADPHQYYQNKSITQLHHYNQHILTTCKQQKISISQDGKENGVQLAQGVQKQGRCDEKWSTIAS